MGASRMEGELLISVVMPVFNGETYLEEALDSIRNQSYTHWELMAIDDGSSDRTLTILQAYAVMDARIKIIRNETNIGLPAALNLGLKNAGGDFIARQDADDISEPHRFQKQYDFLVKHPVIGLVGCNGSYLDDDGNRRGDCHVPTEHESIVSTILNGGLPFLHGSWMFKRSCVEKVGLYNGLMFACEDKDLWLRISEQFQTANLPEQLYQYRMHSGSFTNRVLARRRFYKKLHVDLYEQRRKNGIDVLNTRKAFHFNPTQIPSSAIQSITDLAKANEYVGSKNILNLFRYTSKALISGWRTPYIWQLAYFVNVLFFESIFKTLVWYIKNPIPRAQAFDSP